MSPDVLTPRALNRATLARQLLLERSSLAPIDAVTHLIGLQAQVPRDPYLALWSRLVDFDPAAVGRAITDRQLVRIVVMRGTIHLLTADDCLLLRPLMQPVLDGEIRRHRDHAPKLEGVDLVPVLDRASHLLAVRPMTPAALGRALVTDFPTLDGPALAYACRNFLALVQVPPRGVWRRGGQVAVTTAESWLDRPIAANPSIDDVVLRYLAAFGPVLPADIAAWSRLTGFREVIERLRPHLRTFRDERGRELLDVPNASLPDPDTPAPVRFLPEYDNALLSYSDRTRFAHPDAAALATDGPVHGTALVDGLVAATWSTATDGDSEVTMTIRHQRALSREQVDDLAAEGERLLRFLEPDVASFDARLVAVG